MSKKETIVFMLLISACLNASELETKNYRDLPIPISGETFTEYSKRSDTVLDGNLLEFFYDKHDMSSYAVYDDGNPKNSVFYNHCPYNRLLGMPDPNIVKYLSSDKKYHLRQSIKREVLKAKNETKDHIRLYNEFVTHMNNIEIELKKAEENQIK